MFRSVWTQLKVVGTAPSVNSISGDSYFGDFDDDYEQLVILFPQLQPAKIEAMLKLLKSKEKALDKVRQENRVITRVVHGLFR